MLNMFSFGAWVSQRRKLLDVTQRELALSVSCAVAVGVLRSQLSDTAFRHVWARGSSMALAQVLAYALEN